MISKKVCFYSCAIALLCLFIHFVEPRSVPNADQKNFHSDVIVTKWPAASAADIAKEEEEPGWMRKQLMKIGEVASRVGNSMGAHATKITAAVDKICEIVKTIIPLLAAVCHVGEFKFCAATNQAPDQISEALNPNALDLNILD